MKKIFAFAAVAAAMSLTACSGSTGKGTAEEDSRSLMNLTFVLKPEYQELQDEFMAFATERGMVVLCPCRS